MWKSQRKSPVRISRGTFPPFFVQSFRPFYKCDCHDQSDHKRTRCHPTIPDRRWYIAFFKNSTRTPDTILWRNLGTSSDSFVGTLVKIKVCRVNRTEKCSMKMSYRNVPTEMLESGLNGKKFSESLRLGSVGEHSPPFFVQSFCLTFYDLPLLS
jgi:hypothetical protein